MPHEHIAFLDKLALAIYAGDLEAAQRLPTFSHWLQHFIRNHGHAVGPDAEVGAHARTLALQVLTEGHA
jgi:hypothetical protein